MSDETRSGTSTGGPSRFFPTDLVLVLVLTGLSLGVVFLPGLRETTLRFVFGLLLVIFLPGYAVVAALFPERRTAEDDRSDAQSDEQANQLPAIDQSLDGLERVVLSVGLSIVTVVLFGLLLNYTVWGIRLIPLTILLTTVIVPTTVIATIRRRKLRKQNRFYVPFGAWIGGAYREFTEPDSNVDTMLNVVIAVAIVITMSSLTYAAAAPHGGEQYTELYLLTENESELVADDYPQQLTSGENHSLVVGIGNHELETEEYSVAVELQRVETDDGETSVVERQELGQLNTVLANNETGHYDLEVTPETTGENLRLAIMLYGGEAPDNPTLDGAYRSVHLWVDVLAEGEDE